MSGSKRKSCTPSQPAASAHATTVLLHCCCTTELPALHPRALLCPARTRPCKWRCCRPSLGRSTAAERWHQWAPAERCRRLLRCGCLPLPMATLLFVHRSEGWADGAIRAGAHHRAGCGPTRSIRCVHGVDAVSRWYQRCCSGSSHGWLQRQCGLAVQRSVGSHSRRSRSTNAHSQTARIEHAHTLCVHSFRYNHMEMFARTAAQHHQHALYMALLAYTVFIVRSTVRLRPALQLGHILHHARKTRAVAHTLVLSPYAVIIAR